MLKNILIDLKKYKYMIYKSLLLLSVVFISGLILLLTVFYSSEKHLSELGNAKLNSVTTEMESLFEKINILAINLAQKSEIDSSDELFDPSLDSVSDLQASFPVNCISDIYVFDTEKDLVFTSVGAYTYDFLSVILSKFNETQDGFNMALKTSSDHGMWVISSGAEPQIYYIIKVDLPADYDTQYIIISINTDSIIKYLDLLDNQSYTFFIYQNFYISNHGSGLMTTTESTSQNFLFFKRIINKHVKFFSNDTNTFTYLIALSTRDFYTSEYIIILYIVFYTIVILLWRSQKFVIFRKKNDIKRKDTVSSLSQNLIAITNEQDMDIIDTIQKEIKRYDNNIILDKFELQSHNIRHILFGHYKGTPSNKGIFSSGLDGDFAIFFTATFYIDDYSDMFFDDRDPSDNVTAAHLIIQSILNSLVSPANKVVTCSINGECSAVFCLSSKGNAEDHVVQTLKKAVNLIEKNYGLTICTILSKPIDSISNIHAYYEETCKIYKFVTSINPKSDFILCSTQDLYSNLITDDDFLKQIQIVINTLLLHKFDYIPEMIELLITKNIIPYSDNMQLTQSRLNTLTNLLAEAIIKSDFDKKTTNYFIQKLLSSKSIDDLRCNVNLFISNKDILQDTHSKESKDLLLKTREYIQKNISDPNLSVALICDSLNISKQYLSRIFKQKSDKTISTYINEYRIKYSKHLLNTTSLNISEIAIAIGYMNPDTFTRNFKKVENITPTEYRLLQ